MPDVDFFNFFRWTLGTVVTIYASIVTAQSLGGWYVWLAGSDKHISMIRRYVIVHGLRLRFLTFWGDVLITILLCVRVHTAVSSPYHREPNRRKPCTRMSTGSPNPTDVTALATTSTPASVPSPKPAALPAGISPPARRSPRAELEHLAEEYGLDGSDYKTPQHLIAALHERRQLIASMDRDAMLDVIRWGRRPVTATNASNELLAQQIAKIRTMRFAGLSQRGLVVLAQMRGLPVQPDEQVPIVVRKLKRQEGLFAKLNRKRRAMIGGWVSSIIGENETPRLPVHPPRRSRPAHHRRIQTCGHDQGRDRGIRIARGLTNRIKKSADSYVNQKLDEIEARIDRKLDEIDRRLAEWRDKEIANRLRILKITLWASVIRGPRSR